MNPSNPIHSEHTPSSSAKTGAGILFCLPYVVLFVFSLLLNLWALPKYRNIQPGFAKVLLDVLQFLPIILFSFFVGRRLSKKAFGPRWQYIKTLLFYTFMFSIFETILLTLWVMAYPFETELRNNLLMLVPASTFVLSFLLSSIANFISGFLILHLQPQKQI